MNNNKTNTENRRRAMKKIATGGGVVIGAASAPAWIKPVIESVVLPAHAQTSAVVLTGTFSGEVPITGINLLQSPTLIANSRGIEHKLIEFLVPSAQADHPIEGWCVNDTRPEIVFEVDELAGTVGICAKWLGDDDDDDDNAESVASTLSGNSIVDFQLFTSGSGNRTISFSGCVISADGQTITGSIIALTDDSNDDDGCTRNFTLVRSLVAACPI